MSTAPRPTTPATAVHDPRDAHGHVHGDAQRSVSVDNIHQELTRVWNEVSHDIAERDGLAPIHTSVLNLVIVARGAAEARLATDTLHQLVQQVPSRVIFVRIGEAGSPFDAAISANCRLLTSGRSACYEVIEVRTPEDQLRALPSLLAPLELFDVPSFMWWVGEVDFHADSFQRMADTAERVIIDSARFRDTTTALERFDAFLQESGATCTGTDIAWARATSWRELIAQSFDHPNTQPLIRGIQRVEISYDPRAEAQGLLLAGWLAARLNWTLRSATEDADELIVRAADANGRPVTITCFRQATSGVGLRAVRILARDRHTARISVRRRSEGLSSVSVEVAGSAAQERVVRDVQPTLAELVGRELLIHSRDPIFGEALSFVSAVVRKLRGATSVAPDSQPPDAPSGADTNTNTNANTIEGQVT